MSFDLKTVYKRFEHVKSQRINWDSHWQEVADYVVPSKNTVTRIGSPGEKRNIQVYDGSGIQANELLAGALHGMLTNPSAYWFELYTGIPELDKLDSVRKWMQRTSKTMHDIMNNSNFQTEIHEVYVDLGSFGTGAMSIEEDETSVVRFLAHHMSKIWIEENHRGQVDTIWRCFEWKPKDIVLEFGESNVPKHVLEKEEKDPDCKLEVLHVVYPRSAYDNKSISPKQYKYSSCYYMDKNKPVLLRESGFRTMPYVVPRWTKGTGEVYGRSPGMKCLPDIKMINQMMKVIIRGAEKAIDPPLLVPDDTVIGTVRTVPGGINYFRSGTQDFIRPLETGTKMDLGYQIMEDVRKRIREAFYIDQLQLQEGPQMTATEVLQRTEEKIRLLGPILGRQHSELLQPLVERVFEICNRRGLITPVPEEMSQSKPIVRVQYRSMLAKAQLATEANNITRAFQAASGFIQIDPSSVDIVDAEEGVRYIANLYGLPQELIREKEEVKDIREARAEAQQQAIQAQQQQQSVDQVATLAPALKSVQQ